MAGLGPGISHLFLVLAKVLAVLGGNFRGGSNPDGHGQGLDCSNMSWRLLCLPLDAASTDQHPPGPPEIHAKPLSYPHTGSSWPNAEVSFQPWGRGSRGAATGVWDRVTAALGRKRSVCY